MKQLEAVGLPRIFRRWNRRRHPRGLAAASSTALTRNGNLMRGTIWPVGGRSVSSVGAMPGKNTTITPGFSGVENALATCTSTRLSL